MIGIDLGTSTSCIAAMGQDGKPHVIADRQGHSSMPSVVSFAAPDDETPVPLVGAGARHLALVHPKETVFAAKRLMGRRYADPLVQRLAGDVPYAVVAAPNGDACVQVGGRRVSPQEITAYVLESLRGVAEDHLGRAVEEAVITVPAYFDDAQRQATRDAAQIAGLKVRRLLNEPTAAALGYRVHEEAQGRYAVCHLGGGTFDVSVVEVEDGLMEVVATHGDPTLGGDEFDRRILGHILTDIGQRLRVNLASDPMALGRLREELEKVKHALSEVPEATMRIPYLAKIRGEPQSYVRRVTREELEGWTKDLVDRLEPSCRAALAAAQLAPKNIDRVLLVGGMTRMPAVARAMERIFARPPTQAPNPEEIVALGAATHGALLGGQLKGALLLDVTSRALGIHAGEGRYDPIIPRNATLPTREHKIIPTSYDGQSELTLMIYEGDSADVAENRHLGSFVLGGLPEAPRGEVLILVDFTVDVDGILSVSAKDLSSGTRAEVRLTATCGLSRGQVAELHHVHRRRHSG